MDYPRWLVKTILGYWENLESIKMKITPVLTPDMLVFLRDSDYFQQEHNTLLQRGSQSSRIPRNTNGRAESVAVLMADVSRAINATCSIEEAYAVRQYCTLWAANENEETELPEITRQLAAEALAKLVGYLNPPPS